jgi:hypothetical protein
MVLLPQVGVGKAFKEVEGAKDDGDDAEVSASWHWTGLIHVSTDITCSNVYTTPSRVF